MKDGKRAFGTSITFELLKKVKVTKDKDQSGYMFQNQKITNKDLQPFKKDIDALIIESVRTMQNRDKNPNL